MIEESSPVFNEIRILKRGGFFGAIPPVMYVIAGTSATASINFSAPLFIADRNYEVIGVTERHEVAAVDGGLQVKKAPSGTSTSSGSDVLSSSINLTTTANTNQSGGLTGTRANLTIIKGDSVGLAATGLLTALQGVTVSVQLQAI